MYHKNSFVALVVLFMLNCTSDDSPVESETPDAANYFPPLDSEEWATVSPASVNWDIDKLQVLEDFLIEENTKSFMVLVQGRIVVERYFNGHNATETWPWNSAGKTLVTAITGIAQQKGMLDIDQRASDYLGTQWTSMPLEKEDGITPYHLLTMTSGINDESNWVTKANLTYLADAGDRWSYHNVFQKLIDVVQASSREDFRSYFRQQLEDTMGMDGFWNFGPIFTIYHSDTRSMARFGLLALHMGKWGEEQVVDTSFFNESVTASQDLNASYGYMWWLNGKSSYRVPGSQNVFQGPLVPNAPDDMYAAMGFNEQRIYVIPSRDMVIVRMGEGSNLGNSNFAVSGFDNAFWERMAAVMD
ncbi:MAG: serine hydrolase [Bacteroidota bacterium]